MTKQKLTDEQIAAQKARRARLEELRSVLAARFPAAIAAKDAPKLPLAVGIKAELIHRCPDLARKPLKDFLSFYTRKPTYQAALAMDGAVRVNLDGQEVAPVTPDQQDYAAGRFAAHQAHVEAMRAAKDRKRIAHTGVAL